MVVCVGRRKDVIVFVFFSNLKASSPNKILLYCVACMSLWRSSVALYIIPRCKWGGLGNEKRDLQVGIDSEMLAGHFEMQTKHSWTSIVT